MAWLASDFLFDLRRAIGIASSSAVSPEGLDDPGLLPTVDREIQLNLVPLLLRCREEFLILKQSVAISSSTIRVRIPGRAIAGKVRDIRQTINGADRPLTRYQPEEKARLFPTVLGAGSLSGYYLEGEWIVLVGTPTTSTLDIYYPARPGRLTVTANDFRLIVSIGPAPTYTATWANSWSPSTTTNDIVRGASGLSTLFQDVAGLGISAATSTNLGNSVPAVGPDTVVGDYLTAADLCPVIPLPVELHSLLMSRAVSAVLRQLGKYDEAKAESDTADRLEHMAVELLSPRVESQSKVVVGNFHWRRWRP